MNEHEQAGQMPTSRRVATRPRSSCRGSIDSASLESVVRNSAHDGLASVVGRLKLAEVGLFASSGIAQQ
jgi:hypothetical protein